MKQPLARRTCLACLALPALLWRPAFASAPLQLRPVDDGPKHAGFLAFRRQLLGLLKRRDVRALLPLLCSDVKSSFGGDDTVADFISYWQLDGQLGKPEDSRLWSVLTEVLSLGGRLRPPDAFDAPFVSADWPHEVDPFTHVLALGAAVPLQHAPSHRAATVARLDHEIVEVLDSLDQGPERWHKVRAHAGLTGYLDARQVRSPIDYRAHFIEQQGQWRLQSLLAGD